MPIDKVTVGRAGTVLRTQIVNSDVINSDTALPRVANSMRRSGLVFPGTATAVFHLERRA